MVSKAMQTYLQAIINKLAKLRDLSPRTHLNSLLKKVYFFFGPLFSLRGGQMGIGLARQGNLISNAAQFKHWTHFSLDSPQCVKPSGTLIVHH